MQKLFIIGATDDQKKVLELRGKFSKKYCSEKGWDISNLSFEQILEIRKQPEWKDPLANQKDG